MMTAETIILNVPREFNQRATIGYGYEADMLAVYGALQYAAGRLLQAWWDGILTGHQYEGVFNILNEQFNTRLKLCGAETGQRFEVDLDRLRELGQSQGITLVQALTGERESCITAL